jgi:quinol monooxygenase YgiN
MNSRKRLDSILNPGWTVPMPSNWRLVLATVVFAACVSCSHASVSAESSGHPVVRLAELVIDSNQLADYLAALREEIATSIRVEPGVLTLYAVQVRGDPTRVRLFEMYADSTAYDAHIASPHFRKYKTGTAAMVRSLTLVETDPLLLASKSSDRLQSFVRIE